jgi:type I restriction enzyme, S subunit
VSEWPLVPLRDLCDLFDGPHQTAPQSPGGPVVYLNVGDIRGGRIVLAFSGRIDDGTAREWSRRVLPQPGDVVFGYEAKVGEAAVLTDQHRWCLGRRVGLLRPRQDRLDPRYLAYAWYSPHFQDVLRANRIGGTTIESIRLTDLPRWTIPLPEIKVQRRIAHILGALDDKIELNRRMSETLESMARALFKSWFVDFDPVRAKSEDRDPGLPRTIAELFPDRLIDSELGAIPQGWEVSTVGAVASVIDCLHSKKPERRESGRPLLQLGDVRDDGLLDLREPYLISDEDYVLWTSRMEASAGDCVITNVGRVGAVAQIPVGVKAALGRNMTGVRCKASFPFPTFLLEALLSDVMRDEISRRTDTGTILDALNVRSIPSLRLVRPRDHQLLETYEDCARPLRDQMEQLLVQSRTVNELRDALLPRLLAGEIRVDRLVDTDGGIA